MAFDTTCSCRFVGHAKVKDSHTFINDHSPIIPCLKMTHFSCPLTVMNPRGRQNLLKNRGSHYAIENNAPIQGRNANFQETN